MPEKGLVKKFLHTRDLHSEMGLRERERDDSWVITIDRQMDRYRQTDRFINIWIDR